MTIHDDTTTAEIPDVSTTVDNDEEGPPRVAADETAPDPAGRWARRRALLRSVAVRRRVGAIMMGTAMVSLVITVAATVILWQLIGTINRASGETIDVTIDALESMESTVELADDVISSTSDSLTAVEDTLESVSGSFDAGSDAVADVSQLTTTAEPTLRNAEVSLRALEDLGDEIDLVLDGLSAVPFAPDYDPDAGLGTTFGRLADDLEPLPDEFAATTEGLTTFQSNLDQLQTDVDALTGTVRTLNADLADSEKLVADYRTNVVRAREVAERSQRDLDRDYTLLRFLLVVGAINFALSQLVPLWVGWELRFGERVDPV